LRTLGRREHHAKFELTNNAVIVGVVVDTPASINRFSTARAC
jgi:hypothetical protein